MGDYITLDYIIFKQVSLITWVPDTIFIVYSNNTDRAKQKKSRNNGGECCLFVQVNIKILLQLRRNESPCTTLWSYNILYRIVLHITLNYAHTHRCSIIMATSRIPFLHRMCWAEYKELSVRISVFPDCHLVWSLNQCGIQWQALD